MRTFDDYEHRFSVNWSRYAICLVRFTKPWTLQYIKLAQLVVLLANFFERRPTHKKISSLNWYDRVRNTHGEFPKLQTPPVNWIDIESLKKWTRLTRKWAPWSSIVFLCDVFVAAILFSCRQHKTRYKRNKIQVDVVLSTLQLELSEPTIGNVSSPLRNRWDIVNGCVELTLKLKTARSHSC